MHMNDSSNKLIKELALLNLARNIVDELCYINYPMEWSLEPLSKMLVDLCRLLDVHPKKLGSILVDAYKNTASDSL